MASSTIVFDRSVGEKVTLATGGLTATVVGLYADYNGVHWCLSRYADSTGAIHTEYHRMTDLCDYRPQPSEKQ